MSRPHWVCPCSWCVCFPSLHCSGSRFLCREQALGCMHFPGLSHSGSGSQLLHKVTGWACVSCPSMVRAAQATRCLVSALSPDAVLLITSPSQPLSFQGLPISSVCAMCVSSGELISWLQPSGRMSTIQNPRKSWLETGSLFAVW